MSKSSKIISIPCVLLSSQLFVVWGLGRDIIIKQCIIVVICMVGLQVFLLYFFEDIKEVLENDNTLFVFLFTKKNQIR